MLTHADVCSTAGEDLDFVSHDSRFPCFRVRASECPAGTQFTNFTGTKVPIVTECGAELLADACGAQMLVSAELEVRTLLALLVLFW